MLSHKTVRALICGLSVFWTINFPSMVWAQYLSLAPLEENFPGSSTPAALRDACFNISLWPSVKSHTDYLGGADWAIERMSDGDQQACFGNMTAVGMSLQVEVPALKSWCTTAQACFDSSVPKLSRMIANGAHIGAFFIDEPLSAVVHHDVPNQTHAYALAQTRQYIGLLRQNYPGAVIIEIESSPSTVTISELNTWIDELSQPGSGRPDYFEIDDDVNPNISQNLMDTVGVMNHTRAVGLGFGLLYAYTPPGDQTDQAFLQGMQYECGRFQSVGLNADIYQVHAFNGTPHTTVPETQLYSFMSTVLNALLSSGCVAGGHIGAGAFFGDINYAGASFQLSSDSSFVGWDWNDTISSVRVPPGQVVTLYQDADFGGASLTLTADTPDLRAFPGPGADGTWNDAASSIRIGTNSGEASTLPAGASLHADESLVSPDGRFRLSFQSDGNLVLYRSDGVPIWASNTSGITPGQALMQTDGNFVVYDADGVPWWASGTSGNSGAELVLRNDGDLLVQLGSAVLWESGTGGQ
jgi:hypothetical protein